MSDIANELLELAGKLDALGEQFEKSGYSAHFDKLKEVATEAHSAHSGSWLGNHANCYYKDLEPPPPSAHFSFEWGLSSPSFHNGTVGDWCLYSPEQLKDHLLAKAGITQEVEEKSSKFISDIEDSVKEIEYEIESVLNLIAKDDEYTQKLIKEMRSVKVISQNEVINHYRPTGQFVTRDSEALMAGQRIPAHISALAIAISMNSPMYVIERWSKLSRSIARHLQRNERTMPKRGQQGTRIFIGHGRSEVWRDLKDFFRDRLSLEYDEFNRVSIAGIPNTTRLQEMLDNAMFAFLVMTAEDETAESKIQARMNVIHEVGLFQGRLGFTKAIVLLEDGCEEFSNIQGLGQIRFPKGDIKPRLEDIRMVLEREGII